MFLRVFALALPLVGLQFTLMTTFQAVGKAVQAMLISLGRQAIVFIPLLFIFNNAFGLEGLRYAQPSADAISAVAAALMSISFIRQMRALHDEQQAMAEGETVTAAE
jgi:Na+-driven multidrug efflux pump